MNAIWRESASLCFFTIEYLYIFTSNSPIIGLPLLDSMQTKATKTMQTNKPLLPNIFTVLLDLGL